MAKQTKASGKLSKVLTELKLKSFSTRCDKNRLRLFHITPVDLDLRLQQWANQFPLQRGLASDPHRLQHIDRVTYILGSDWTVGLVHELVNFNRRVSIPPFSSSCPVSSLNRREKWRQPAGFPPFCLKFFDVAELRRKPADWLFQRTLAQIKSF